MFYTSGVRVEYREEPCKVALNRVKGMPFDWSLNPYMGCVHQCTFCYVRAFELRADRPYDDRYGRSIRVKTNVVEVLRRELARPSWRHEPVAIGAATDPYQPAEGRYRLTARLHRGAGQAGNPFSIITRGPLIVRDVDVLADGGSTRGRLGHVLGADPGRRGLAKDGARDRPPAPAATSAEDPRRRGREGERRHGADPAGISDKPSELTRAGRPRGT